METGKQRTADGEEQDVACQIGIEMWRAAVGSSEPQRCEDGEIEEPHHVLGIQRPTKEVQLDGREQVVAAAQQPCLADEATPRNRGKFQTHAFAIMLVAVFVDEFWGYVIDDEVNKFLRKIVHRYGKQLD
ncbi:hypothetical protein B0H13DRAFT_1900354 [Mycena leptocephala]|nr:hypothetical protein B0H13DRAFT_1900354 [Mycena leptocephala]